MDASAERKEAVIRRHRPHRRCVEDDEGTSRSLSWISTSALLQSVVIEHGKCNPEVLSTHYFTTSRSMCVKIKESDPCRKDILNLGIVYMNCCARSNSPFQTVPERAELVPVVAMFRRSTTTSTLALTPLVIAIFWSRVSLGSPAKIIHSIVEKSIS